MLVHQGDLLRKSGLFFRGKPLQSPFHPAKDLGVSLSAPGHHDEIGAPLQSSLGIFRGEHIPTGDHRDAQSLFHPQNGIQIAFSRIHLLAGAAVDAHGIHAAGLGHTAEFHTGVLVCFIALAEFHCQRHLHRLAHGPDQFFRLRNVAHQGAALSVAGDLGHGAAHVDVHKIRPRNLQGQLGRLGADFRLRAEDLHAAGVFFRGDEQQLTAFFVLIKQGLGADHLGIASRRALLAADGAEGRVGDPGHGAQQQRVFKRDISYGWHAKLSFVCKNSPSTCWARPL